ncbi:hypothetical protein CDEF62S_02829 [Castellaniella defragrans]
MQLVRRSSVPMLSLNRRPVTHAVRTTFSYIDRVETTPLSGTNGLAVPAVSVNQKEETVGSLLTLLPDAQEDGQILLSLAYDNTVAQPLKTVRRAEPVPSGGGRAAPVSARPILAPRLVALYGVGRALMAEVQVGRDAYLYVKGQTHPAGMPETPASTSCGA